MAWLNLPPSGTYQIVFRFAGRNWKRSLDTTNPQIAERARLRVEENLRLVQQGRLDVPNSVDVAEFLLYDGKLTFIAHQAASSPSLDSQIDVQPNDDGRREHVHVAATIGHSVKKHDASKGKGKLPGMISMPLDEVFQAYLNQLPPGALAEETLRVAQIHFDHLTEVLGADTPILAIDYERLQGYVNQRSKSKGRRGKPLSSTTIKKELGTLSSVWTWAQRKFGVGVFPGKKLSYPATSDKPEFQTILEVS